jgi:cbb3-type cytochrome oxidase subunit 3
MDMGIVRGLITLALMLAFAAVCVATFSRSRKREFDAMARLPLEESAGPEAGREADPARGSEG